MDIQTAERATRHGAIAGFLSATVTFVTLTASPFVPRSSKLASFNDPWTIFDVALAAGLAYGVLRKSRTAALLLFTYFVAAKIYMAGLLTRPAALGMTLVLLYFFGRAIRGSFAYHRLRRAEDPTYRPAPRWAYFVWPPVALLGALLLLTGLAVTLHIVPPTQVLRGQDLHQRERDLLLAEKLLAPDEAVVLFYSGGALSIRERGTILTEQRVVSYVESDGELSVVSAPYSEIEYIAVEQQGTMFHPTVIAVMTTDGRMFRLLASTDEEGDRRVLKELYERRYRARHVQPDETPPTR